MLSPFIYVIVGFGQGSKVVSEKKEIRWFDQGVSRSLKLGLIPTGGVNGGVTVGGRIIGGFRAAQPTEGDCAEILLAIVKNFERVTVGMVNLRDILLTAPRNRTWEDTKREFVDGHRYYFKDQELHKFMMRAAAFLDTSLHIRGTSSSEVIGRVRFALAQEQKLTVPD